MGGGRGSEYERNGSSGRCPHFRVLEVSVMSQAEETNAYSLTDEETSFLPPSTLTGRHSAVKAVG